MVNAFRSGLDSQRAHLFLRRAAMKSSSLDAQSQVGELIASGKFSRILTHSLSLEESKRRQLKNASTLSSNQNSVENHEKNAVETAV